MKTFLKIIAVVLALVLIFSVVKNSALEIRNMGIDSIKASVKTLDDSYYTDEDIESAVECVKEHFKIKEWPVFLLRISFSDEESRKKLVGYHLTETTDKENIIVLFCDFFVLKSFAAYSQGIYPGWSAILVREEGTMNWKYVDGGYA